MAVKKGQKVKVKAVDFGSKGEAVCKYKGFTIFVPKGVIGDQLLVEITKKKSSYAVGKIVEILKSSDKRQNPPCKYFDRCGGCQIQDVKYKEQLKFKKSKVKNTIERIAEIKDFQINDTYGMESPFNYRNKGQFPIKYDQGKIKIGFYEIGSHNIVDIDKCIIQNEVTVKVKNILKGFIINNRSVSIYNEKKHTGLLRHLVVRSSVVTNEVMIVLVTNGKSIPNQQELIDRLSSIDGVKSIYQNINTNKGNRILGNKNKLLYGNKKIVTKLGDLKFKLSPLSFFQINNLQTQKLYSKVLEYADLTGSERVFDLYCGLGSISLFLAKEAKSVIGIEIVKEAIKDARKNAKLNNIENAKFYDGRAKDIITKLYSKGKKADVVVLDPPRKGCDKVVLETLVKMNVEKIVYVSCKPSTLARDLKFLTKNNYELKEVQPVDMFPHSTHVETVTKLCLNSNVSKDNN